MLDDVEETALGTASRRAREIARADQKQRRPPRSTSIDPMAGHTVGVVQALGVAGACRGLGIVEKPGQRPGDGPDDHEGGEEAEQGPAHGWQDTTRALTSVAPTCRKSEERR